MAYIRKGVPRDIPHEEGNQLIFDELTGKQVGEADQAGTDKAMAAMTKMNVAGIDVEQLRSAVKDENAKDKTPTQRVLATHDGGILLKHGCKGATGPLYDGKEFNADELDGKTRAFALDVIVEMNFRPTVSEPGTGTS